MIPLFSPLRQNEALFPEIERKLCQILRAGRYILGKPLEEFEQALSEKLGYQTAIGCSSGTDALVLSLKALQLELGDEVITPAFSFVASANAIAWVGLKPVFADVSLDTGLMTLESIDQALTPKTRAIIFVDLYGRQGEIEKIRKHCDDRGLFLIEDGAQSIGVHNQSAHTYTLSFYPTKNIGTIGDAGAVLTDDANLALRTRMMSRHGGLSRSDYEHIGTTARLDSLHAAILSIKLEHLESWSEKRIQLANRYIDELMPLEEAGKIQLPPQTNNSGENVWSLFTLRVVEKRNVLAEFLQSQQIGCGIYYPHALSQLNTFKRFAPNDCPNANQLAKEVISIPIYPELTDQEFEAVCVAVKKCLS